jgi:GntR family transcriptional repressor for pyruvate dehydrogenase complex
MVQPDSFRHEGSAADLEGRRFRRLEQTRAHEYVAEQVRRQIALGLIPSGEALPPERELAKLFGVGRATVQHALRLLEADGLAETRRGRSGGTFVIGPADDRVDKDHLLLELRRDRERIEEALDYRRVVEPAVAETAAVVRTGRELDAIREAFQQAADTVNDTEFMAYDTRFHLIIAGASHNRFFYDAIEKLRLELNGALVLLPESPLWRERSASEHAELLAAIKDHNGEAARKAMLTHLDYTHKSVAALLVALSRRPSP